MENFKILIVEDSSLIAIGLKINLEKYGYVVLGPAASGEEAINIVKNENPNLVLMDIILAGKMDGIEAAIEIKKFNDVPVLYLTGHADDQKVQRAKQTNPLGYIVKPYKDNQLKIIIEMAFNKIAVDKELEHYRSHLEELVKSRTEELELANLKLQSEISEHKRTAEKYLIAKEKAEESEKLKTAFLTNISHEIRTPMNAIVGFAELLNDDSLVKSERKEYVEQISNHSNQLLQLITNIIDVSRIEANQLELMNRKCSINDILSDVYSNCSENVYRKLRNNVEFNITNKIEISSTEFLLDTQKIIQIFGHLLDNSFKFTEKGFIHFGVSEITGEHIVFYVHDTGIGIPENKLNYIFDRFRKIDDDKTKLYGGVGLGLTITRSLVKFLDGDIWADSIYGEGTKIYFSIPFIQKQREPQIEIQTSFLDDYNWKGKLILIVEDEEDNYKFMEATLRKTDVDILWARDGKQGVDICSKIHNINVIIMDIKLPELSGYDASRQIKQMPTMKNVPIIALTAFAFSGAREKSLDAGCSEYLTKPITPKQFLAVVDKYLKN